MSTVYDIDSITPLTALPGYKNVKEIGRSTFAIVYVSIAISKHVEHWRSFS